MTEMATETPASPRRVTLLLVHGAGFCRQVWQPLVRRLRASPLLVGAGEVSFVAIDLPFHGVHGDASAPARVYYEDGAKDRPRVSHPGNEWVSWSSAAVYKAASGLQRPDGVVIGIGHSMGAAALWRAEAAHPGTFHGLVLFEPIYGSPRGGGDSRQLDFMVDVTLKRASEWCDSGAMSDGRGAVATDECCACRPSKEAALDHFMGWRNFAAWDRESLACWVQGAVVPTTSASIATSVSAVELACAPAIEASMYCGARLWLSEEDLAAPKCRIFFEGGGRSRLVAHEPFAAIAAKLPDIYTAHAPIPNLSHLLVMEDPGVCTDVILADLGKLAAFAETSKF